MRQALWAGVPADGWAGPGFDFGSAFWTLIPAFLFISALTVVQANSLSLVAQRVSWRDARGDRLPGGAGRGSGQLPGQHTGRSRRGDPGGDYAKGQSVRAADGLRLPGRGHTRWVILVVLAFFPKAWALLLVIPIPVMAAYMAVVLAPMFIEGMKSIIRDEPDYSKSLVGGYP